MRWNSSTPSRPQSRLNKGHRAKSSLHKFCAVLTLASALLLPNTAMAEETQDVVFVCQYGYAKSLVAARHFERLAKERGLNVRVYARGMTPKDSVPAKLAAQIAADGFDDSTFKPTELSAQDVAQAEQLVSFGVDLPASPEATTHWDDVPALSEDYDAARNSIVAHLGPLLDKVSKTKSEQK